MVRKNFRIIILFQFFILLGCYRSIPESPQKVGFVDLSKFDFRSELPFDLNGPWEMYWNKLYSPEDFQSGKVKSSEALLVPFRPWSNQSLNGERFPSQGFATYRITVRVPETNEIKKYAISYTHLFSASKLFVNGKFLVEKGKVSSNLKEMIPQRTNTLVEFEDASPELEIILQISNRDFYKGGPRGEFLLSTPSQMEKTKLKSLILEIFIFGLIFGATIYHLFFYFLNRNEKAFLYFSILCVTFLIRFPFLNSKIYEYFFPIISADWILIILNYLNISSFLAANLFINALFKIKKFLWINKVFYVGAFVAIFSPLFPSPIFSYFNLTYIIFFLVLFITQTTLLIIVNEQDQQSFYLMGIGLAGMAILCFVAIFLNFFGQHGGQYLIIANMVYVIFQSLFISNYFIASIKRTSELNLKIQEQNQLALQQQRSEMQFMVHDQLGAGLTDLKVFLERTEREKKIPIPEFFSKDLLERINRIISALRNQLLQIEDFDLINENFLTAVNLTLLRRYSDAGRELEFAVAEPSQKYFQNLKLDAENRKFYANLYNMMYELATNDIKYGIGESKWSVHISGGVLFIEQSNEIQHKLEKTLQPDLKSVRNRLSEMNGFLELENGKDVFRVKIQLRLHS